MDQEIEAFFGGTVPAEETRDSAFKGQVGDALRSTDPKTSHAVEIGRELELFDDQLDLHALLVGPSIPSRYQAVEAGIMSEIYNVIRGKIGDKAPEIDEWLTRPKFVARDEDPESRFSFQLESLPGKTNYESMTIRVSDRGETLIIHSQDSHGKRSHRVEYMLDLGDPDEVGEDGYRSDNRGLGIFADYSTDTDGNIKSADFTNVGTMYNSKYKHNALRSKYTHEKALALIEWLEGRAGTLLEKVQINGTNSELYAHDLRGAHPYKATPYARVEDLDLG